ncbi:Rho GTPase-activating protein 15 [Papilio machaon]|uniref:Rho GTPase-activating protein 15 n=1 Tax=Papilio machaon TaxID=76193 RepID=A0A0N0PC59_PAPMA|nr:Rho GTPase-activating protein 15 [Papilio machaon]
MACEVASWVPSAVAATLRDNRSATPVIEWLAIIRASIEEYDPLVAVSPPVEPAPESEDAFDAILSQLGTEIYKLDEYHRNLVPAEEEVSLSILNIFDECLQAMEPTTRIMDTVPEDCVVNGADSDCESSLSDVSFVTSTPAKSDEMLESDVKRSVPVPMPRRTAPNGATGLDSDTDSESTCWSYKECSSGAEAARTYAAVWAHSSGFHNSDEILRRVLSQHHATISRIAFDEAGEFTPPSYSVYSLHEVDDMHDVCDVREDVGEGDRCAGGARIDSEARSVGDMTPDRPDDGYEPVRDALTTDENIYEEIEYGYSYTDEGCSCGGSVEVESCSVSASSEGVGRESPLYANLRDHDAYAIPPDVIFWKNLLTDPFYNEDEEDEGRIDLAEESMNKLFQSASSVVDERLIKRTKYSESGKKSKKNWSECYMVLTHTALYFYKDQRTYNATKIRKPGTPPSPTAPRAELILPLRNAHVLPCIQAHTRRYTRSFTLTVGYDTYLLQDESDDKAKQLLMLIQNIIYNLGPPTLEEYPPQYQSSNTDLESLGRTPPVARHARHKKAGGSSNEDLSDSTEVSTQKSQVTKVLRKFFPKRPTMEDLVKKGIYKDEPVFGRKLEEVCSESSPRVPEFVRACVREIESTEENLSTDGLYRASGNLSQVQKIRLEIDQKNQSVISNNTDIHVLTGALKLFFRELKEPLIPCTMFDRVLSACSIKPREARIKEFREIVNCLPECNRDTLKFLLEHLLKVTQYSERNRMHTANLAIVFGPTLLWAPAAQAHNIAVDCIQQNNVVDILLNDYHDIFDRRHA